MNVRHLPVKKKQVLLLSFIMISKKTDFPSSNPTMIRSVPFLKVPIAPNCRDWYLTESNATYIYVKDSTIQYFVLHIFVKLSGKCFRYAFNNRINNLYEIGKSDKKYNSFHSLLYLRKQDIPSSFPTVIRHIDSGFNFVIPFRKVIVALMNWCLTELNGNRHPFKSEIMYNIGKKYILQMYTHVLINHHKFEAFASQRT